MGLEFKIENSKEVFVKRWAIDYDGVYKPEENLMPKKANPEPEDDLEDTEEEAEEEETEEEDEEESEDDDEDAEEEESDDEETEEEDEEEEDEKPAKKSTKAAKVQPGVVLLKTGIAKKVDILKVMGKNVKVRKPGDKNFPPVRVPITDCRMYVKEIFEKLEENNAKILSWKDKNIALFQKLDNLVARKGTVKKGSPLEEL